jgi:hypothetical protein
VCGEHLTFQIEMLNSTNLSPWFWQLKKREIPSGSFARPSPL